MFVHVCMYVCSERWVVSRVNGMTHGWWEIFWGCFLKQRRTSHSMVAKGVSPPGKFHPTACSSSKTWLPFFKELWIETFNKLLNIGLLFLR